MAVLLSELENSHRVQDPFQLLLEETKQMVNGCIHSRLTPHQALTSELIFARN